MERKMARRFAKVSEEEIEEAFFYPSDLVNTKTTIPLRVGEERWIYTSTLRVSVYIHHYWPPLWGIVDVIVRKLILSRKKHFDKLTFYFSSLFLSAGATVFVHGRGARPTVSQCLISESENVGIFVTDGAQVNKTAIVSKSWGITSRDKDNTIACNTLKPLLRADRQERANSLL